MVTLVTVIVMPRGNAMKVQVFGCSLLVSVPRELLRGKIAVGGGGRGGSGLGSVLLLGKGDLSSNGGSDLRMVRSDGQRDVGGSWVEAGLISIPVNSVELVIGADILVAAPHDHDVVV